MLEQGRQLHMEGRLGEAATVYQKILSKDPGNAEALHLLGVVSLQNGDFPQAIRLIRDSIAMMSTAGPPSVIDQYPIGQGPDQREEHRQAGHQYQPGPSVNRGRS